MKKQNDPHRASRGDTDISLGGHCNPIIHHDKSNHNYVYCQVCFKPLKLQQEICDTCLNWNLFLTHLLHLKSLHVNIEKDYE